MTKTITKAIVLLTIAVAGVSCARGEAIKPDEPAETETVATEVVAIDSKGIEKEFMKNFDLPEEPEFKESDIEIFQPNLIIEYEWEVNRNLENGDVYICLPDAGIIEKSIKERKKIIPRMLRFDNSYEIYDELGNFIRKIEKSTMKEATKEEWDEVIYSFNMNHLLLIRYNNNLNESKIAIYDFEDNKTLFETEKVEIGDYENRKIGSVNLIVSKEAHNDKWRKEL